MRLVLALAPLLVAACDARSEGTVTLPPDSRGPAARRNEPPIPVNGEIPMAYPPALAAQRLGGSVILRLYVDSVGHVVPESTAVQESSGYPALDSAALAGAARLRYAPALRGGAPIGTAFLQPVNFRPPPGGALIP